MFKQNSVLKRHLVWWWNIIRKPKQKCEAGSRNLKQCYKSQRGSQLELGRLPMPNCTVLALHKTEWSSGNLKRNKWTQFLILSDVLQIHTWNIRGRSHGLETLEVLAVLLFWAWVLRGGIMAGIATFTQGASSEHLSSWVKLFPFSSFGKKNWFTILSFSIILVICFLECNISEQTIFLPAINCPWISDYLDKLFF